MNLINEDLRTNLRYVPTKKLNIHQNRTGELNVNILDLNQVIRSKSNADISFNNPAEQSDQPSEFKRIYENEFSMRLRAKSADKAFANQAQNDYTTNSINKKFNCPLNQNLGILIKIKFLLL